MNNEESRLRTFSMWPSDAAVDPARIAKAGFFYTGQGLEVQCFSCGGKITEWNYGDQVMAKHRRLDPHCPFVINPSSSGNVPKLSTSSQSSITPSLPPHTPPQSSTLNTADSILYRTESVRLASFIEWPATEVVTPETLAKAGFYSLRQNDMVKCAFCSGMAGFWEPGDDPKIEHRRHFPYCSFVLANFNPDELSNSDTDSSQLRQIRQSPLYRDSKLINSDALQELGIQAHKGPRQPRYSTVESRLRTFVNWSVDLIQTPEMLSEAGFYYVGTGDQVRCFHCDGGLRHWDPEDEPWVEHGRWFPACAFVRLIKGQDFIQSCTPQQVDLSSMQQSTTSNIAPHSNGRPTISQSREIEISDQDIQVYMNSAQALVALSIGLPVGRVKQAIRQKIQETGSSYNSADALIEATLNLQLEDTDAPSAMDSEIQQEVTNILTSVIMHSKENERTAPVVSARRHPVEEDSLLVSDLENVPKLSLEEENRQLKEARLCKICMDNEIGVVFLPCGHLTTCVNCAPSLSNCPVCRSVIKGTVRTFLS